MKAFGTAEKIVSDCKCGNTELLRFLFAGFLIEVCPSCGAICFKDKAMEKISLERIDGGQND